MNLDGLEKGLDGFFKDASSRKEEWFRYYRVKDLSHQFTQVHLLKDLDVESVLEIGPHLGFVSALLTNAGFRTTGFDIGPPLSRISDIFHIRGELLEAPVEQIDGHDAIICCEVLEHYEWDKFDVILKKFRETSARYVILSIPYAGFQIDFRLYVNAYLAKSKFSWKKFKHFFKFKRDPEPWGHKWEAGYRGFSLDQIEEKIHSADWSIARRVFTSPCRSVFYLLRRHETGEAPEQRYPTESMIG